MRAVCSALAILLLTPPTAAQTNNAPADLPDIRQRMFETLAQGLENDYGNGVAQVYAMLGREDAILDRFNLPKCVALPGDPIAAIVARARETNIVVINEDHAAPYDRHFIARVLEALKPEGYTIYAVETLATGRSTGGGVVRRPEDAFRPIESFHPTEVFDEDGYYLRDPVFGRTMRLAKALGYSLVNYEQSGLQAYEMTLTHPDLDNMDRRELAQTSNLMRKVFTTTPDAKVVIHVGHSHVWERQWPQPSNRAWLAERLKTATGRDPLTIDQTRCQSTTGATVAANARMSADGAEEPARTVDMFVGHAPLAFRNGRVAWRQDLGEQAIPTPASFLDLDVGVLVEARPESAAMSVTPADRLYLRPGEVLPLLLAPGRYRVDGFTDKGRMDIPPVMIDVR